MQAPPPGPTIPPANPYSANPYSPSTPAFGAASASARPEVDRSALKALRTAAIISLIGLAIGLVAPQVYSSATGAPTVYNSVGYTGNAATANNTTIALPFTAAELWTAVALSAVGYAIGIVAVAFFRDAFTTLRGPDPPAFSTPRTLSILLILGMIGVLLGAVAVAASLVSVLHCAPSAQLVPLHCFTDRLGGLLAGALLVVVGGILYLVGGIGVVLGIYRVGTRYGDSIVRAAAILYIIPLINVVGAILLTVRANALLARFPAPAAGSAPLT